MRPKIAVCDAEKVMLRQLAQYLERIQAETKGSFDLFYCKSAEELLAHMPADTQVILRDISMDRLSGLDCARALRAKGCAAASRPTCS